MEPKLTFYQHLTNAKELLKDGKDISAIEEHLKKQGLEPHSIVEILQFIQPEKKNKTQSGSKLVFFGVVLLAAGFFGSLFYTDSAAILNFTLYGLTGIGIVILIIGLAMIFH